MIVAADDARRVKGVEDRCIDLSDQATAALRSSDYATAAKLALDVLAIERELLASLSSPPDELSVWISSDLVLLGRAQLGLADPAAARVSLTEAVDLDRGRMESDPLDSDALDALFHSLHHLGFALRKLRDEEAEAARSAEAVEGGSGLAVS